MKASTITEKLCNLLSLFGFPGHVHTDQGISFMRNELKEWLHGKGIPTSRTTRYNPKGNGQVERFNRVIWKSVLLGLLVKNLSISHWETVLCDVLHSLRSLLCTATNCTPHERMFLHLQKSSNGVTMSTWLRPDPVYVKRHVRNKGDLLVDEAKLIEANPQYAHVRFNNGRETTVSLCDLAPHPRQVNGDCNDLNKTSIENTETRNCAQSDFFPSTSDKPLNNDEPSEATNTSPGET